MPRRRCACDCGMFLPDDADPRARYFDVSHRRKMEKRRARERKRNSALPPRPNVKPTAHFDREYLTAEEQADGRTRARRGALYEEFLRGHPDLARRLISDTDPLSVSDVAEVVGTSQSNVSRWLLALREDLATEELQKRWKIDTEDKQALDDGYRSFVERFHPETEVRWYDDEWEDEIDSVVGKGGNLLLLAPQRHGKTNFLSLYCIRRITQDPNIRILWVSRTQDQAAESVGYIRQLLEEQDYTDAVLGPGRTFRPPTRGKGSHSWTDTEFTVGTRNRTLRAPTMRAIGIGQTVSGRDADLIIIDDPQEREDIDGGSITGIKQRKWFFTTFMARKMPHTGIAYITSRKHVNDIPAEIIERRADDWRIKEYQGHDTGCLKDERDYEAHTDCVMWPSQRPFEFLMKLKADDEVWFECNIQNNPTADRLVLTSKEKIAKATNPDVMAGHFPPGWSLIAGFDPASGKDNAAVLWAYSPEKRQAQIVTAKKFRPGPAGLSEAIADWYDRFHCVQWVTETNWAGGFLEDVRVTKLVNERGIRIIPHQTKGNKTDYSGGVTSMIQTIGTEGENGRPPILFPTLASDEDSQGVRALIGELLTYDPDANKHAKDDTVLAMWFPWWKKLLDLVGRRPTAREAIVEYDSIGSLGGF